MASENLPGPSGLSLRKRKTPIVGEDNILAELFDNSGSDYEELQHSSDSEFVPSDGEERVSSDESNSDENEIVQIIPSQSTRGFVNPTIRRQQTNIRVRGGRRGRGRVAANRGRTQVRNRIDMNYPEDAELGWQMTDPLPQIPAFTAAPGISADYNISENSTPFDIFSIFFNNYIFDWIKSQTNKYARDRITNEQKKGIPLKRKSLLNYWKAVSASEIRIFFSLILHMSLVVKPTIKHYWTVSSIYASNFCKQTGMSRDRFLAIMSMLHMNDNSTYMPQNNPAHDRLHKIRPIHDHLHNLFHLVYTPRENLTIDEGICPFRGRINFRVYIKGKPHKYGLKLFMVCESLSGYCSKFEIYTGSVAEDLDDIPITIQLIERLLANFENKGYCVYFDRFFSSPALFDILWNKKIKAVGTVMSNRVEMPKKIFKNYKLKKGESIFRRRNHLLAVKWRDNREVYMLSTIHRAEMKPAPTYLDRPPKLKPSAILSYNKNKIGVDHSDQLLSYNSFKRKTIKWWKKLFFHLFDLTIINSQILYNISHPNTKLPILEFYEAICSGLLAAAAINLDEEPEAHVDPGNLRLLSKNHYPEYLPSTACKKLAYKRCKVCTEKGRFAGQPKRLDTRYMCDKCGVPLCIIPCFKNYHTILEYWK